MSTVAEPAHGPLSLAELIDLEVRLLEDRERDPGEVAMRDARIADALGGRAAGLSRRQLVRHWLAAVDEPAGVSVGERISGVYRLAGIVLPIVAFAVGAGTAAGLLAYDGRDPVNIVGYLAVLVFLQAALIVLTVVGMLPRAWLGGVTRVLGFDRGAGVPALLRELAHRSTRTLADHGVVGARGRAALGRLAAWQTIYADVERWLLTALTQRAAVAFNLGALAATIYLVTVRALAFAWSTTLEVDPAVMTRFFHAMATPWLWLEPAVPSRELVAASRYFPGRAYDPDLLGDWWPFLVAALVTYALVPRIVLAAYAAANARRARARLTLDHGECAALCERLLQHTTLWGRGDAVGPAVAATPSPDPAAGCALPANGVMVRVLRWADAAVSRDDVARLVGTKYGWQVASLDDVRGDDDPGERRRLAELAASDRPVLVVAEAFEPPSKSVQRLLQNVRGSIGERVPVIVALLGGQHGSPAPKPDDVRIWSQRVAALGDPWLRVEAVAS
jgi:hypothetical protein